MRGTRALALLVVVALLAGCTSGGAPTPTASPTPMIGTDCGYTLSVDTATDQQRDRIDRTVAYEDLSEARRTEFDRARANGSDQLGESLPETWSGPVLVTDDGEQYYAVAATC